MKGAELNALTSKPRVLFVAGLTPVERGGAGGQLTEATTLYNSGLRELVEWIPLSTTMKSIPPPPLILRAFAVAGRLLVYAWQVTRVKAVLIFLSDGSTLYEKGLMCLWARLLGRRIVLRFGGGAIAAQCERSRFFERWVRHALLGPANVVSCQGSAWSRFFSQFPEAKGKISEIPNGLTLHTSHNGGHKRISHQIAFVGWMNKEKGIFEIIDVLRAIRQSVPDVKVVMAGGGRDLDEFNRRVQSDNLEGSVSMLGWIAPTEVRKLLRESRLLLFPSHSEGLPNAVLEAMAEGTPVVATRVGALPDVITDGRSGFLVDVRDVRGMIKAVTLLLEADEVAEQIGEEGRRVVLERYDIAKVWPMFARALGIEVR